MKVFIPKDERYFWGAEYTTKGGYLDTEDGKHRIQKYVEIHSLEHADGFSLDEQLQTVLHTNATTLEWASLEDVIQAIGLHQ
jgi:hypothetical protein